MLLEMLWVDFNTKSHRMPNGNPTKSLQGKAKASYFASAPTVHREEIPAHASVLGCIFLVVPLQSSSWLPDSNHCLLQILLYSYESLKKKKPHAIERQGTEVGSGDLMGFVGSYLIARCTPGLEALGMMPTTVNLAVLVEVDQIDQQFIADAADEARRVPANAVPGSRGKDGDVPSIDLPTALLEKPT